MHKEASSNALHTAVLGCHIDIVKILLDNGADANIPNQLEDEVHGNINIQCPSPLVAAFQRRQYDIARLLLARGAILPKHNSSELVYEAIQQNEYRIVKLLLINGAQLPKDEKQSDELLEMAAKSGNIHLIRALLEVGVSLSARFGSNSGDAHKLIDLLRTRGKMVREKELQNHTLSTPSLIATTQYP